MALPPLSVLQDSLSTFLRWPGAPRRQRKEQQTTPPKTATKQFEPWCLTPERFFALRTHRHETASET